jgi:hypothetical protein
MTTEGVSMVRSLFRSSREVLRPWKHLSIRPPSSNVAIADAVRGPIPLYVIQTIAEARIVLGDIKFGEVAFDRHDPVGEEEDAQTVIEALTALENALRALGFVDDARIVTKSKGLSAFHQDYDPDPPE